MNIGYSFWGFLGAGIQDTPDGGRSHRSTLIDGLINMGHSLVFLQPNRDLLEAGEVFPFVWDPGFPDIDLLFLEWRWPIPGRNVEIEPHSKIYTPDLDRQNALIQYYTFHGKTPTFLWDKDQKLEANSELRALENVRVAVPARFPARRESTLLFPISDAELDLQLQSIWSQGEKPFKRTLVYIGNQYERDEAFSTLFAVPAKTIDHAVFGKWSSSDEWAHVKFNGRVHFKDVARIYAESVATVLLAPDRYCRSGQITQRLFEALMQGCFPIAHSDIKGIDEILPKWLIINSGDEVADLCEHLMNIRQSHSYRDCLAECLEGLHPFRMSHQQRFLEQVFSEMS
ncbi:glycosyltransferase family 1 protein [Agrobacterium tumefaciens]|uniref:glycosyltransferase family protein n=1 Tax=Agrobacterium tumefaciens TaxID=358 RepID=UPI0012B74A44|nr:glycosyltransferase [Agrobacterium tumefaciens]MQB08164.1 glycosyltransferase family 1 protein [Agrobacterium tumefaciens]